MLVDLARNDLGRVAASGSVHVDPYRKIERYSHVMHIVSGVQGLVAPGKDAFDLFAAAFPAGTLVGAPKVRAMQLIAELEPTARGLYGGTVGYFAKNGNMDQAITIRTMVFDGDEYSFQAGAGIVSDSARSEYRSAREELILRRARFAKRVCERAAFDRQLRLVHPQPRRRSSCSRPRCSSIATTRSRSPMRKPAPTTS
jgi:anthranilate synthase component 1